VGRKASLRSQSVTRINKNIWGDKCNDYTELNRLVSLQEKLLTIEQLKLRQVPKTVKAIKNKLVGIEPTLNLTMNCLFKY